MLFFVLVFVLFFERRSKRSWRGKSTDLHSISPAILTTHKENVLSSAKFDANRRAARLGKEKGRRKLLRENVKEGAPNDPEGKGKYTFRGDHI